MSEQQPDYSPFPRPWTPETMTQLADYAEAGPVLSAMERDLVEVVRLAAQTPEPEPIGNSEFPIPASASVSPAPPEDDKPLARSDQPQPSSRDADPRDGPFDHMSDEEFDDFLADIYAQRRAGTVQELSNHSVSPSASAAPSSDDFPGWNTRASPAPEGTTRNRVINAGLEADRLLPKYSTSERSYVAAAREALLIAKERLSEQDITMTSVARIDYLLTELAGPQ